MRYNVEYDGRSLGNMEVDESINLTRDEFFAARREVVQVNDFETFARKWRITFKAAKSIYGNEIVHTVKKRFHILKRKTHSFFNRWKEGESIVEIARSQFFPPVLIARFLLEYMGYSKAEITACIRDPHQIHFRPDINNQRLIHDIVEAHTKDFVYSSAADEKSRKLGEMGENRLEKWLKERDISFRNEDDLAADEDHRERHGKTPDILLDKQITVNGMKIKWIESKSLFGTPKEMNRHNSDQFQPYLNLFGNGLVVYWYGFTMDVLNDRNFFVVNKTFFEPEESRK